MYEKYCSDCIKKYGVTQDLSFHKRVMFDDWDVERKQEFKKDLAMRATFHVSENVQPETISALSTALALAADMPHKKRRKRSHAKHNH